MIWWAYPSYPQLSTAQKWMVNIAIPVMAYAGYQVWHKYKKGYFAGVAPVYRPLFQARR